MNALGALTRLSALGRRSAASLSSPLAARLLPFVAVSLVAAALPGLASPASASTEIPGRTITADFPSGEPAPPTITATAAILIDAESGAILYSRNANARLPMASTTKIMTAMVVLESLQLDDQITVSANAHATPGSVVGLQRGEVRTVEELMYALLVASANDAAVALAEAAAGSVQAFVNEMNHKAEALGLTNTRFANPNGLNAEKHFSSAKDLADLTQYAMQEPVFRRIVGTPECSIPLPDKETPRKLENGNLMLSELAWVTGVKTGSTPYAQYCLVVSGSTEGVSLIGVLLGAVDDETRWREARALLDYGLDLYPRTVLINKGELIAELDTSDYLGRQVRLVTDRPLTVRLGAGEVTRGLATVHRETTLPVHAGDVFGEITFTLEGETLGSVRLVAAQSVDRPTLKMILEYWRRGLPSGLAPIAE